MHNEDRGSPGRGRRAIIVLIIALVLFAIIGGAVGFTIKKNLDNSQLNSLQAEVDSANSKLTDLQPKIDDYEEGISYAEAFNLGDNANVSNKRLGDAEKRASEDGKEDAQRSDSNGMPSSTPENVTEPFAKDGVIIVNKKHPLPSNYNPGENSEARGAVDRLVDDAVAAGVDLIHQYSSFRSYTTQAGLFNSYAASSGVNEAETYSARPGYSEHQTGLAFDLKNSTGGLYRISDSGYNYDTDWVAKHAHEYGFIIRYRDEWRSITGYVGEPWHLRYLGVDLATKVYNSGKTLEEYLGVDGGDYAR